MWKYALPLVVLVVLIGFFVRGLSIDPREVPSPLINKPAPQFTMATLKDPAKTLSDKDLKGKVWLLNVWATWCVACREEHETLVQFARTNQVPIYGLDYKDDRNDALNWLKKEGDPYVMSIFDKRGTVAINWGVYGAPETFLVDKTGTIRYKYIGPLTPAAIAKEIMPRVLKLRGES